ncbi:acylglycerol kinase, mitochondrial-like [Babylonia areolata]|uniref:acylglycerol kinase, mitochondrial-like n=1 Tax=Babylonia areolata TaxID=304850 RepID=UPI003FD294D9
MAFVVKIGKTLRNHWKKSTFFTLLSIYGVKYGHDRYEEHLLRRIYCAEAKKYGEEKITLTQRPRRVTVFLNPAAQAGKSRKLFEKNAAPILYLAGMEVNVVKTEYEGQVKKFISVLESGETDAIIVAGGDGTLLEAVTGILRKDNKTFHNIPVGVIPVGYTNTFARLLYGVDKGPVRMMADAAMAVVKNVTKKVDVLKVDGGEGKTTFALCGMEIGAYRDAEDRKSRYWYFGPLKSRWTYVSTAMKTWPPAMKAKVTYVEATEENMKGVGSEDVQLPKKTSWSFWNFLLRRPQEVQAEEPTDMKTDEKDEEEERVDKELSTVELTLMSPNMTLEQDVPGIHFEVGPADPSKTELISEGLYQKMILIVTSFVTGPYDYPCSALRHGFTVTEVQAEEPTDMKTDEKDEEEERVDKELSTVELTLMSPNMTLEQDVPGIHFEVGPADPSKTELISEGWKRMKRPYPKYGGDNNEQLLVKDVSIQLDLPEQKEGVPPVWYNIDGESFEAIPVTVSLLQKKLNFFYPVYEPSIESS